MNPLDTVFGTARWRTMMGVINNPMSTIYMLSRKTCVSEHLVKEYLEDFENVGLISYKMELNTLNNRYCRRWFVVNSPYLSALCALNEAYGQPRVVAATVPTPLYETVPSCDVT